MFGTRNATSGKVKAGKETTFSEAVATLLKRAALYMENTKKIATLSPLVSANTMVSSFPETALMAKMLDSRLPVPGLLQLPLIEEVRAGLEKHVASIIDFDGSNAMAEASKTAHEAQRHKENQIGTDTRPLLGKEKVYGLAASLGKFTNRQIVVADGRYSNSIQKLLYFLNASRLTCLPLRQCAGPAIVTYCRSSVGASRSTNIAGSHSPYRHSVSYLQQTSVKK